MRQPDNLVLGKPLFFATAMPLGAYGLPMLVESHEGRPTKIEGNPQHPATLGGTDPFMQASVLDLYDPDRSQTVTYLGDASTWGQYAERLARAADGAAGLEGRRHSLPDGAHQLAYASPRRWNRFCGSSRKPSGTSGSR